MVFDARVGYLGEARRTGRQAPRFTGMGTALLVEHCIADWRLAAVFSGGDINTTESRVGGLGTCMTLSMENMHSGEKEKGVTKGKSRSAEQHGLWDMVGRHAYNVL